DDGPLVEPPEDDEETAEEAVLEDVGGAGAPLEAQGLTLPRPPDPRPVLPRRAREIIEYERTVNRRSDEDVARYLQSTHDSYVDMGEYGLASEIRVPGGLSAWSAEAIAWLEGRGPRP
ncbi:MAG TPA: hypothetical protein VNO79_10725, partial [Actinomycetota bacterium]|nr:hypothetical protein [Actinomycetota bacterium]